MVEHKFKLSLDDTKEQIYYERPTFSLDGKQLSCIISPRYKITDSSVLRIQVNANAPIYLTPTVEEYTEQGYTVINTKYSLLKVVNDYFDTNKIWFYFIGNDGCIKSGYTEGISDSRKIIFDDLGVTVDYSAYDCVGNTIEVPTTYYIEDGMLNLDGIQYNVVFNSTGVDKYQHISEGLICLIKSNKKTQWKKRTRLTFTLSHDSILPLQMMQLGKEEYSLYYKNKEYRVNTQWNEEGTALEFYVCVKTDSDGVLSIVSTEEVDTRKIFSEVDEASGGDIITIDSDNVCRIHSEFVPNTSGELLFIYAYVEQMSSNITTDYFIAERTKPYDASFYADDNGKIRILGVEYDVSTISMIDFHGWKEVVFISEEGGNKIYSFTTDGGMNVLVVESENGFKLFSELILNKKTDCDEYPKKQMQKVVVSGIPYYKDLDFEREAIVDNETFETETIIEEVPFYIPIQPKYRLNIVDYTLPNMFVCQLDLDNFSWLDSGVDNYSDIREDIYYNLSSYALKYQQPLFIEDKTDEQALLRRYESTFELGNIEKIPSITIIKEQHDMHVDFPMSNLHGTNLFQEMWVSDKFAEKKKKELINPIIDMEKDIYYPMRKTGGVLTDITDVEFYLHFRTRNDDWEVNEDYKGYYDIAYFLKNSQKKGDTSLTEVNEFLKTSWNIFDYYEENIFTKEIAFYQPSDLLSFLDFGDDDVFYQKSKISKSFLRISFYDSKDPQVQSLLGTSTVFLDGGKLFGIFSNGNISQKDNIQYLSPLNWSNSTSYISVNREPSNDKESGLTFDEDSRLSSKLSVSSKNSSNSSSEGFYAYIFREYSSGLHERTIYAKFQFNHAGKGTVIDLFQPMKHVGDDFVLYNMEDDRELMKQGINIQDVYDMMYVPILVKYDLDSKKYCWYLPSTLSDSNTDKTKIKFNLYEIKIKNYDSPSN